MTAMRILLRWITMSLARRSIWRRRSEKEAEPYYAVIARKPVVKDGSLKVVAEDGQSYVIPDTAEIKPFRTRNVVRAEDIQKGSRCLIWLNEQGEVVRVALLDAE